MKWAIDGKSKWYGWVPHPHQESNLRPYPKYVYRETNRHGNSRLVFRKNGHPRITMPSDVGSKEFWTRYAMCIEGVQVDGRLSDFKKILKSRLEKAKLRAAKKKVNYDIDYEWAAEKLSKQGFKCALTGIPFDLTDANKWSGLMNPYAISLDRIVPSEGYTKENTRLVCIGANIMLSDWGLETAKKIASKL